MNKKILLIMVMLISIPAVFGYTLEVLETNPAPLRSGEYADITVLLTATHTDGVKENIVLSLESSDEIRVLSNQELEINSLRIGDRFSNTFRVFIADDLRTGMIPIKFILTEDRSVREFPREVFVRRGQSLPNLLIGSVSSIPQDVIRDSKNNILRVELINLGDKAAELIVGNLISSNIKESSAFSLRDTISILNKGESSQLEFRFDVEDVDLKSVPLTINLNYKIRDVNDDFSTISESLEFDLTLKQTPKIEVLSVESLDRVLVGSNSNRLKITLINRGLEEGEDIRLRLYPDVSYPFDFTKTNYYVSSLMKYNETASVIVDFDVLNTGSVRSYPMNVEIESVVGNARYTQRDRIDIAIVGEASSLPVIVRNSVLVIAFLIAIFFGIRKYIKKTED